MILHFNWLPQIEAFKSVEGIEHEFAIFTYSDLMNELGTASPNEETLCTPHKYNFFILAFHNQGATELKIDMVTYNLSKPYNLIKITPGQIVTMENTSENFDATIIILSRQFVENLLIFINNSIPLRSGAYTENVTQISHREKIMTKIFIRAIRHILRNTENPFRLQVVQHAIMAIFYSSEQVRKINENETPRSNADVLSQEFLTIVKENFRKERQLQFYADKLCITPRYLSRVVKESTNYSAAEWIERYVVLEAQALLKSTNMTIQQISDELNFPSQTFFGKYFKRRIGLSPKEYRRKG